MKSFATTMALVAGLMVATSAPAFATVVKKTQDGMSAPVKESGGKKHHKHGKKSSKKSSKESSESKAQPETAPSAPAPEQAK